MAQDRLKLIFYSHTHTCLLFPLSEKRNFEKKVSCQEHNTVPGPGPKPGSLDLKFTSFRSFIILLPCLHSVVFDRVFNPLSGRFAVTRKKEHYWLLKTIIIKKLTRKHFYMQPNNYLSCLYWPFFNLHAHVERKS